MKKKDKAFSALLAVFPTSSSWKRFVEQPQNEKIWRSFTTFAVRRNLVRTNDRKNLENFIHQHSRSFQEPQIPKGLDFAELLDKKEELLKINLSGRALTDRVNALISEEAIDLPKVSNSMLTRLKKESADTPYKQNVLRSLAFWLGHDRGELSPLWNYETLIKLCGESKTINHYREGVRIGFSLFGRGDVIDHDIVGWLRKSLKSFIEQSADHFLYGRWGRVRSHDITTIYVDFPKEEEAGDPVSYRKCLRSAISLAHQVSVRWVLSKYCTKNRFLSIGIAAGEFSNLDNYLLPVLNAKLPSDPMIRVTDYVRQCLLINDIRAILCERPSEITLFNGETLTIWWITSLWTILYFDFVPDLLEDPTLQNHQASKEILGRLLWSKPENRPKLEKSGEANAVSTFFKFPHHSLLGVEIAKTLYYRRRFREALEILRIILSIEPVHLIARTLRMVIFRNLALNAPTYNITETLFRQAEQEAQYILQNCTAHSEDFFCEYGVNYLNQAMVTVRSLRQKSHPSPDSLSEIESLKQNVFSALDQAEMNFEKAMTMSPSGIRSSYLLDSVRVIKSILKNDQDILTNLQKPIDAHPDVVGQPSRELQWQIGFWREDLSPEGRNHFLVQSITRSSEIHDDSISLQTYRPTTYFCTAVCFWDFLPQRTVADVKFVLQLLHNAKEIARAMGKLELCIYSFTRSYGEMMSADEFIRHVEKAIHMVESCVGGNLSNKDDREVIVQTGKLSSLLMTLNY